MLSENLKNLRKSKGLSQEELAIKLNVVRQTVSKWEKGLSVPDSEMLICIAAELDTTVTILLGKTVETEHPDDIAALSAKLELLNEQFAKHHENRRRGWRIAFWMIGLIGTGILASALTKFIYSQAMTRSIDASMDIIGGADGPTAIFFAGTLPPIGTLFIGLIAVIAAAVGIFSTYKR